MKCVSLCSGIGGIELGLELVADVEPIAFVESDPYCRSILAKRWPKATLATWKKVAVRPSCSCGVKPVRSLVCDPFMGTGTTGIAANSLGHNFFGCEGSREHFEISVQRLHG